MQMTKENNNAFLLPFLIIKDIFSLAFKGVKFLFWDIFKYVFNHTSEKVDHAYQSTKQMFDNDRVLEEKKKNDEKKAKRQEKYNNLWFVKKQNAKLEEMSK